MGASTQPAPLGTTVEPARAVFDVTDGAARFADLWYRCVASPPSPDGATVYADLQRRYEAPFRRFHNLGHIQDCLRRCDEVAALLVDRAAVEFALWFHDAVYDIGSSTNELRSAELFLDVSAGAPFMFRHRVCDHILATRHLSSVSDSDRRFIVDIDLSGFGAPWDEFMRNGALLRDESSDVPDVKYHCGQVAFLSRLQKRRHFFATEYFRTRFESTARENLRRILAELRAKGYGTTAPPTL
jgi:predicted metal-dependent HD superfamily phosphohydrolase